MKRNTPGILPVGENTARKKRTQFYSEATIMIILRNGREYDVPDDDGYVDVPTLRRAAAVPPSRIPI